MEQLAPGLRRWTAWRDGWDEDVGCVAVDTDEGLVLIDPLDPPADVAKPAHVLLTVFWHDRSVAEIGGARVWAPARSSRPLANRGITVTDTLQASLPAGILAFPTARPSEVVFYVPQGNALVVGDVLLGAGAKPRATDGPLRLCPERWLGTKRTHDELRESLRPLLELPVERVLVSHGAPVLADGKRELETVLR